MNITLGDVAKQADRFDLSYSLDDFVLWVLVPVFDENGDRHGSVEMWFSPYRNELYNAEDGTYFERKESEVGTDLFYTTTPVAMAGIQFRDEDSEIVAEYDMPLEKVNTALDALPDIMKMNAEVDDLAALVAVEMLGLA